MQPLGPSYLAPLFRPLLVELITLLRSLNDDAWLSNTLARGWRVRDIAAHLLDGDLRKISAYRDGHLVPLEAPIQSSDDLARFINTTNASGVAFAQRLSPRVLTDLLEATGAWVAALIDTLDPQAQSLFAVSWAGELTSLNWMDTGREHTERWHHQAQIRDAVGAPRLLAPEWLEPLLDMSVRVLPHAYATMAAREGTTLTLAVTGETSASWSLQRQDETWRLFRGAADAPATHARFESDTLWRLFYNALSPDDAMARAEISGDLELAQPLLRSRSVIV